MKAVLSNRILMDAKEDYIDRLDKELTYIIPAYNPKDPPTVIKNLARIRPSIISIPIGRQDLIPSGYEIVDRRVKIPAKFPEFNGILRPSQKFVYEELEDNALINAWVSWGKTFTALAIAGKLKQRTLIITHTVPLRNQWVREIKKVYGIEPSIIGSGKFDIGDTITVGNVQSLYRRITDVQKAFGTVILDEFHHVPSKTFSRVMDTNHARYKIGLSGTLERKDGRHVVFRDYFSNNIFKPPKENYMTPEVHIYRPDIRFMDGARIPWANRVTNLCENYEYQHFVAMLAAAYAAMGHKVLVVSDRVQFLKTCRELVGDKAICITGDIGHDEREDLLDEIKYGDKEILFGTKAIFAEGISANPLSCLILGTPINNDPLLTQLIGRVIRKEEGKMTPIIADIHLKGNTARKQASNRIGYYMRHGYKIKEIKS